MAKESKSANDVSPEQINQWIKEHQENENSQAQDKLVTHYRKLIESLAYKYSKGQSHKEIGPRIKKISDELTTELERSPSISEIAQRLEVSDEEVLEAMEMGQSYNALSVDHSIEADKDGSTVTLLDIMGQQDDNYDLTEKRMILERILPILSDRERQIIQCTFIEGLSQKETGERIGLSQMHVSRLQRTAIKKLQEAAKQ